MHPSYVRDVNHDEREELHIELVARNAFRVIMVGAVAFLAACAYVLVQ
jgi:hypothetical protein